VEPLLHQGADQNGRRHRPQEQACRRAEGALILCPLPGSTTESPESHQQHEKTHNVIGHSTRFIPDVVCDHLGVILPRLADALDQRLVALSLPSASPNRGLGWDQNASTLLSDPAADGDQRVADPPLHSGNLGLEGGHLVAPVYHQFRGFAGFL